MTNYTLFADKPAVRFRKSDPLFFVAVLLLWSLGMVTLYVSTQEAALRIRSDANSLGFFYDQLKYSCVAFVAFCAMAFLPVNFIKKISVVVFYACFILCVMAFFNQGSSNDNMEIKGTQHIWVHNNDYFYGEKGSGDHGKGDGSLDSQVFHNAFLDLF